MRYDRYYLKEVNTMKEGIHPKYQQTQVRCACGEIIETGSTKENIHVEICSKCHPIPADALTVSTNVSVSTIKTKSLTAHRAYCL